MNDAIILNLSKDIVEKSIGIKKNHEIKLPNAIIAATAMDHGLNIIPGILRVLKIFSGLLILLHIPCKI